MKLVSTVLLSLFFVVLIDARSYSENNYKNLQWFNSIHINPNHPIISFRGNSRTNHIAPRIQNTECQYPTNKNYERQTITLMKDMLTEIQKISLTLQQPIKFQMDEQNTMEDNSKLEEDTKQDIAGELLSPVENSLPKVFFKEVEFSKQDDDEVNESKKTEKSHKVAEKPEEPDDNMRPVSFVPVKSKTFGKNLPFDHGSKFY